MGKGGKAVAEKPDSSTKTISVMMLLTLAGKVLGL